MSAAMGKAVGPASTDVLVPRGRPYQRWVVGQ